MSKNKFFSLSLCLSSMVLFASGGDPYQVPPNSPEVHPLSPTINMEFLKPHGWAISIDHAQQKDMDLTEEQKLEIVLKSGLNIFADPFYPVWFTQSVLAGSASSGGRSPFERSMSSEGNTSSGGLTLSADDASSKTSTSSRGSVSSKAGASRDEDDACYYSPSFLDRLSIEEFDAIKKNPLLAKLYFMEYI